MKCPNCGGEYEPILNYGNNTSNWDCPWCGQPNLRTGTPVITW